jgi:hypothetical protein
MLKAIFITSVFSLFAFCHAAYGQSSNAKLTPQELADKYPALMKQADEMVKAAVKNDYDRFADFLHPKIIERNGGKEKFVSAVKETMKRTKSAGIEVVEYSVENPAQIVEIDKQLFAVLPTRANMKTPQGALTMPGHLLGISEDKGENWKFIRMDKNGETKSMFPGIVDKLEIFKPNQAGH